jgi:signal transduction histidine kinase
LAALSAGHVHFYFLFSSRNLGRGDSRQAIVLGLLARLAPLGLVLQTLVVEENLLAHGPHELFTAIDASDRSIRKFRRVAVRRSLRLNVWHEFTSPLVCVEGMLENCLRL